MGLCLIWTVVLVIPVLFYGFDEVSSPLALAFSAVGMSGGAVVVGELWRRVVLWDTPGTWGLPWRGLDAAGWGAALLGVLSLGIVGEALGTAWWNLLSGVFGWELPTDALAAIADALTAGPTADRVLFGVVVVLAGPLLEELVFRGFLWRLLGGSQRPVFAILWTSLLFAGWHLDPIQSVGVLPLAIFLGVLRWKSGSLLAPVAVHVANNGLAMAAILSGSTEPTPPLWLGLAMVAGTIAFAVMSRRPVIS